MELQKVFQEVNRKLAYNTQHPSKESLNGGVFFVCVWLFLFFLSRGWNEEGCCFVV